MVRSCASRTENVAAHHRTVVVQVKDQNDAFVSGAQVSVQQSPPMLRALAATEVSTGVYQVDVGSDRCGGPYPIAVTVNGVTVGSGLSADFDCAPVDAARSGLAVAPAAVPPDATAAIAFNAVDVCGLPAFGRAVSFRVEPPSLAMASASP